MDPALLKQHQAYLKRASSTLAVEKRKVPLTSSASFSHTPTSSKRSVPSPPQFDYKTAPLYNNGSSQRKFGVLTSVVRYMKSRHLEGDTHPLSLEEIREEANIPNIAPHVEAWLETEALPNNPKIQTILEGNVSKFTFKPKYNIRSRKDITELLKIRYRKGEGGVLREELEECVPKLSKSLQALGDSLVVVTRPIDKKEVIFYNDKSCGMVVDEEFKKYWRSISVEKLTDQAIEQSLEKNGITSQAGEKKVFLSSKSQKKPSSNRRRGKVKLKDNAHLESVLQDFTQT